MSFIISFLLFFLVFNIPLSSACIYYVTSHEKVTRNDTLGRMCEEVMGFSAGTVSAHTWRDWNKQETSVSMADLQKYSRNIGTQLWYL